jgi:putative FmdB family regulatory protein
MPLYEYFCNDCHASFSKVLTVGEHDGKDPRCPKCSGENVEQRYSAFFAVTSRKSA